MDDKNMSVEELLRENLRVAKDTNRMLHSMRRKAFWGGIFKMIWWVLILVVIPYYAYVLYFEPYVKQATQTYQQFQDGVHQVQGIKTGVESNNPLSDLKKLLDQYQASQVQGGR